MAERQGQAVRVYRLQWWRQTCAVVFLAIGSVAVLAIWQVGINAQPEFEPFFVLLTIVFLAVAAGWAVNTFTTTVTLLDDAVELRTIFGRKRMLFSAIRGRREYVHRDSEDGKTHRLKLEPSDSRLPALEFDKCYTFDAAFYEWFNKLPDLDAMDKERLTTR